MFILYSLLFINLAHVLTWGAFVHVEQNRFYGSGRG